MWANVLDITWETMLAFSLDKALASRLGKLLDFELDSALGTKWDLTLDIMLGIALGNQLVPVLGFVSVP